MSAKNIVAFGKVLDRLERQVREICEEENPGKEVFFDGWRHTLFISVGEGDNQVQIYYDVYPGDNGEPVITGMGKY